MDSRLKINGKLPRSRIVTASGCRATTLETILNYSKNIRDIGIFTTKSIGPEPNPGNPPPIYCADFSEESIARRNAVGLANPGIEEFEEELAWLRKESPDLNGALLLGSAYGSDLDEMLKVCRHMAPYVDAIEINFSCPHAKGYGLDTGRDSDAMARIVNSVQRATGNDIFTKLSPNLSDADLAETAKACIDAGARGITVINTIGPGESYLPGTDIPVLFNRKGGLSGQGVTERGVDCTKIVREAIGPDPLIIGMGGVFTGRDAQEFMQAGADYIGIGTVMEGMESGWLADYICELDSDIDCGSDDAKRLLTSGAELSYTPVKISGIERCSDDLRVFRFEEGMRADPCQYLFLAVPGDDRHPTMEAPFSIPVNDPLTLAIRKYPKNKEHHFTSRLWEHEEGDTLFVRGPYGVPFNYPKEDMLYLVGGGTGTAALASIAKEYVHFVSFIGARTWDELLFTGCLSANLVFAATEDGSGSGHKGQVTDMFDDLLTGYLTGPCTDNGVVVTCGPTPMMQKVVEIANRKGFSDDRIYVIMEPHMKCGVGICGSCSDAEGNISCTDGHIITADRFKRYAVQGKLKRNACGGWER